MHAGPLRRDTVLQTRKFRTVCKLHHRIRIYVTSAGCCPRLPIIATLRGQLKADAGQMIGRWGADNTVWEDGRDEGQMIADNTVWEDGVPWPTQVGWLRPQSLYPPPCML